MGDRGNIVIKSGNDQVWLYTHWSGSEIKETLRAALKRNERWSDPSYLARIVFQELIGDDKGTTGFGISGSIGDNEHPILVADCDTQTVYEVEETKLVDGRLPKAHNLKGAAPSFREFAGITKEGKQL